MKIILVRINVSPVTYDRSVAIVHLTKEYMYVHIYGRLRLGDQETRRMSLLLQPMKYIESNACVHTISIFLKIVQTVDGNVTKRLLAFQNLIIQYII